MRKLNTITVGEMKDLLRGLDDESRVAFACNYGDRARTHQVIALEGCINDSQIHITPYSESGWAVSRDHSYENEDTVFIIS